MSNKTWASHFDRAFHAFDIGFSDATPTTAGTTFRVGGRGQRWRLWCDFQRAAWQVLFSWSGKTTVNLKPKPTS